MESSETPDTTQKSVLDISVRNPVAHNTWEKGRYTSFEVAVNTSNKCFCLSSSTTRRRFSEFVWLRKILKSHHPLISPPSLPPKKFFEDRFDPVFIAMRMKGLEDFLNSLLNEKVYLSDTTLHLFLQTNLTTTEIHHYIEGKMPDFSLDSLWKANGIKENMRDLYTEDDDGWFKIQHRDKMEPDNSSVSSREDNASSHTKDGTKNLQASLAVTNSYEHESSINSSSYSSDEGDESGDGKSTEFPSLSLVRGNKLTCTGTFDSSLSTSTDKSNSSEFAMQNASKENTSHQTEIDSKNFEELSSMVSSKVKEDNESIESDESLGRQCDSSITCVELTSVTNFEVDKRHSINNSD